MKRDLKKWLNEKVSDEDIGTTDDMSNKEKIESKALFYMDNDFYDIEENIEKLQEIWCAAQKQFLKDLLDGMDDDIDKLFGTKASVTRGKAQLVAYISSLKTYFHSKYLLLKKVNRG